MMNLFKPRKFAEGEFISRTQMPIGKVDAKALIVRSMGISVLRGQITACVANDVDTKHYIAAMNFSVAEVNKELKKRGVGVKAA